MLKSHKFNSRLLILIVLVTYCFVYNLNVANARSGAVPSSSKEYQTACFSLSLSYTGSGLTPTVFPTKSFGCDEGEYNAGTNIYLDAYPASGWHVGSWSGTADDIRTYLTNTATFSESDLSVSVHYEETTATDDFVITVDTTLPGFTSNAQFYIRTQGSRINYNVDCDDDGTFDELALSDDYTCEYDTPGIYTIRIRDNKGDGTGFPGILFADVLDAEKLISIDQWGTGKWSTMWEAFKGCENMVLNATDAPDLSNVLIMQEMFSGATLFDGEIGRWDTGKVTDMSLMFFDATSFNGDIGAWDTHNVDSMHKMFMRATSFNQDIGAWDTSRVITMSYMFTHAPNFNQDISGWDTSANNWFDGMFYGATAFNQDIGGWDTSSGLRMWHMFHDAPNFNQDISGWSTTNISNMDYMFSGATGFDQDISGWDLSNVINTSYMFEGATAFNTDISGWDMREVVNMNGMFKDATSFNQDIGVWNTAKLTRINELFMNAIAFDQNLSNWNVSGLYEAEDMLKNIQLSPINYDALLNSWGVQPVQYGVVFDGGNSTYCEGEAARNNLINSHHWNITDGGKDCPPVAAITSPQSGGKWKLPRTMIFADASDDIGVQDVKFYGQIDGGGWILLVTDSNPADGWEYYWDGGFSGGQIVDLKVLVTDNSNLEAEAVVTNISVVDRYVDPSTGFGYRSGGSGEPQETESVEVFEKSASAENVLVRQISRCAMLWKYVRWFLL